MRSDRPSAAAAACKSHAPRAPCKHQLGVRVRQSVSSGSGTRCRAAILSVQRPMISPSSRAMRRWS
eukprot:11209471-Lingulodinium_polyedra.AAC.1